jgi:hypothetical protein
MIKRGKRTEEVEQVYMTEDQLKAEALEKQRLEREAEAALPPKSPLRAKWENYWYHYRIATFVTVFFGALAIFFLADMIGQVKPDYTVVLVTSVYVPTDYTDRLAAALEANAADVNGDGKVKVALEPITFTPYDPDADPQGEQTPEEMMSANANAETDYAYSMKLMGILAAGTDPIYLLDEPQYDNLIMMSGAENAEELFQPLEGVPGAEGYSLPFSRTALAESPVEPLIDERLSFYLRVLPESNNKKDNAYRAACRDYIAELAR